VKDRKKSESGTGKMKFKSGMGWKACYDAETGRCTAETGGGGGYDLYEITPEIFDAIGGASDGESVSLIHTGRHLYMDVNDRCGPPYTVVFDDDYRALCPWASIVCSGHVWDEGLTDAAVETFASEEQNREQRRKKREGRRSD